MLTAWAVDCPLTVKQTVLHVGVVGWRVVDWSISCAAKLNRLLPDARVSREPCPPCRPIHQNRLVARHEPRRATGQRASGCINHRGLNRMTATGPKSSRTRPGAVRCRRHGARSIRPKSQRQIGTDPIALRSSCGPVIFKSWQCGRGANSIYPPITSMPQTMLEGPRRPVSGAVRLRGLPWKIP